MRHTSIKIFLISAALLVMLSGVVAFFFYRGVPIHDINIWRLQGAFAQANIQHPRHSALLRKKIYLGGPDEHGSRRCIYVVGEARVAPFAKDDINKIYQNASASFGNEMIPVHILFSDQRDSPYEMPFIAWQEELANATPEENTPYIVYITTQRPFLADPRCDD